MRIIPVFESLILYMKKSSFNKIAVIGDVHGCFNELVKLYSRICKYTEEVYSVGDLIDRGPDSEKVIQFCIENSIKPVRGNHEDMLIKAINKPGSQVVPGYETNKTQWLWNGGDMTIHSYISGKNVNFNKFADSFRENRHYGYISKLPYIIELDNYIISHAGIANNGHPENILWNREEPSLLNKLQIIGHTPNRKVIHKPGHYINVDTGCVFWGKMSAVILSDNGNVIIIES